MQITHGNDFGTAKLTMPFVHSEDVYARVMETLINTGEVTGWDIEGDSVYYNLDFTLTASDEEELEAQIEDMVQFVNGCI